jgi:nickel superoxide dismutase
MLNTFSRWFKIQTAEAHCDVPCGVYDPASAALAAKTVAVLAKKITDLPLPGPSASPVEQKAFENTVTRMVQVKEEHAQLCKKELLILWTDYFKPQHLEMFPDLHPTFWNAAKLCSYNKQNVDVAKAEELQKACAQVADMFAKAQAAAAKAPAPAMAKK